MSLAPQRAQARQDAFCAENPPWLRGHEAQRNVLVQNLKTPATAICDLRDNCRTLAVLTDRPPLQEVRRFGGRPSRQVSCLVPPVTGAVSESCYSLVSEHLRVLAMMSFIVSDRSFRNASWWNTARSLITECQQRIQSRFELGRLSERDLGDMRLTRLEIFDETQKPFWQD